jgi:hypothetical protein
LVVKRVVRSANEKAPLSVSKNQLKKIKPEGHFEGKNKVFFNDEGKAMTAEEKRLKERLAANREAINYDRIQVLEDRLERHKDDDELAERQRRKVRRQKRELSKEVARHGERQAVLASADEE